MQRLFILSGTHIALAAMTEADQPIFWKWLQNPILREQIDDARVPTMEDQRKWFQRVQEPDRKFFSLVTVPNTMLIGNCGYVDIDTTKSEATLRITIGDQASHGKGYGTEAVQLLLQYGFEVMKLQRVLLKVLQSNLRAVRTYEKVGFRTISQDLHDDRMMLTMELTRDAYPSRS